MDYVMCPLCWSKEGLDAFDSPITHWCCPSCKTVFVEPEPCQMVPLNANIEYVPTYKGFIGWILRLFNLQDAERPHKEYL